MHVTRRIWRIVFSGFVCTMVSCHVITGTESIDATSQPATDTTQQHDNNNNTYATADTLEGFLQLFEPDSRPQGLHHDNRTGKTVISAGGGEMAKSDVCSPRPTSVKIEYPTDNPRVVFFPVCTLVERCGGCTTSPNVACVPTAIERSSYKALSGEYPTDGSGQLINPGYINIVIERHLTCRVQCMLDAEKCGPGKSFNARSCSCDCLEVRRCLPPLVFDPENCSCNCGPVNCCPAGQATPCRLVLNNNTCQCDVTDRMYINAGGSIPSLQQVVTNAQATPSAAAPNTTSTTSSANDPCANYKCPPRTVKYVNNRGVCACRLQNTIPRQGGP
ncbi:uncharacterized protein LOC131950053 [Physella acuta]|uniref:uncharacterized protein LOC131950053 n=1 Tax=Physella acuta TaxID=109671 RepID=UPI0027DE84A3|nr:uncharacterized protein LOC131950053 [Physella acuta]